MKSIYIYQLAIVVNFLVFSKQAYANASMPAFWNTGSGHTLNILDNNSQSASKNIRMDSEKVIVLLHQGFAVVKGEYNMFNDSNKELSVEVGYPENKVFTNPAVKNIVTGKIDNLLVLVDDKKTNYEIISPDSSKKWYVWKTKFKPHEFTKIIVYFLTDNHSAKLSKGYDSQRSNGFTYIVESGKAWKNKIGKGSIYIKLMDDVLFKDILAVFPSKIKYAEASKTLIYSFENLEPNPNDNIVISYDKNNENFDFFKVKEKAKEYFQEIDDFKIPFFEKNQLKEINKDNFEIPYTSTISFYLLITGIVIQVIFILFVFMLINFFIKRKIKS